MSQFIPTEAEAVLLALMEGADYEIFGDLNRFGDLSVLKLSPMVDGVLRPMTTSGESVRRLLAEGLIETSPGHKNDAAPRFAISGKGRTSGWRVSATELATPS